MPKTNTDDKPRCPHFGKCGGCNTQHIPYEVQVENKKKFLTSMIILSDISEDDIKIFPSQPYNYRNRMDLIFTKIGLGFRVRGKWQQTVNIDECHIAKPKINQIAEEIKSFFKNCECFNLVNKEGTYRYAVIRTPENTSSISFVLNSDSFHIGDAIEKIKEFAKKTDVPNILVTYVHSRTDTSISDDFFVVKGSDMLKGTYLGKTFHYHVQGFFQNNSELAEQMHEYVNNLLKENQEKYKDYTLWDLYAGVGTFGIINADLFKNVLIVESFPQCIDAAKLNLEENKITNAETQVLDARYISRLDAPEKLIILTDPPRSGMHPKTVEHLNKLNPELLIYVSCNMKQLARDLPKFKNHKIKSLAIFDFFPQTPHCEVVVELIRKEIIEDH
ncbi:23S rRNA (uracil(1939)-C(5))-methyltransferase RlmD [Candidatus Woesearchaeota archaeon]|jgi:23S rRNA (uracil1939-C5)-methyltransferase|nr:23S rRNA (uracil(1939)-C(5))-methyltransferase RlmD [Candidatus Woesearchaeota archaeon]MBT6519059.1 23S rRNA (uracil(1939)-C(5))-methyltransferase RlmD [Candidatus Woesearchaeota archaeon]MBT7367328.1 23S rRNA (uracil(1939)-C(5))-methyltransferase RlmD [Candidatus Woesearchaeota archaeon]